MKSSFSFRQKITSDWSLSLVLLCLFLAMKGYKYGWDDQYLEIPLLKSLIDPSLYPGDYYVASIKDTFSSFFYPLLANVISVKQIPSAYFILYVLSRYCLLFAIFKFWEHISRSRYQAFVCTVILFSLGNIPEFFYRTFSHQEFALTIILSGWVFFFKDKYKMAAVLWGIAANFHLLYSLFSMFYLCAYLISLRKKSSLKSFGLCSLIFLCVSLPVIIWTLKKRIMTGAYVHEFNWYKIFQLACPQNFICGNLTFKDLLTQPLQWILTMKHYLFALVLYFLNFFFHPRFRENRKCHTIAISVLFLLAVSYFFTYTHPSRFVIDLNLFRNMQFFFFILSGYTTLLVLDWIDQDDLLAGFLGTFLISLSMVSYILKIVAVICLIAILLIRKPSFKENFRKIRPRTVFSGILLLGSLFLFFHFANYLKPLGRTIIIIVLSELLVMGVILRQSKIKQHRLPLRRLIMIVPLITFIVYGSFYHYRGVQRERTAKSGLWKIQRDWEDMQYFAKDHTPTTAMFLVPHDMEMGGFRIFSERALVAEGRDWGIVGFDYAAAEEFFKRLREIEPLSIHRKKQIPHLGLVALINKYKVDYIVFMKIYEPFPSFKKLYEKIYENDTFSLFEVQ